MKQKTKKILCYCLILPKKETQTVSWNCIKMNAKLMQMMTQWEIRQNVRDQFKRNISLACCVRKLRVICGIIWYKLTAVIAKVESGYCPTTVPGERKNLCFSATMKNARNGLQKCTLIKHFPGHSEYVSKVNNKMSLEKIPAKIRQGAGNKLKSSHSLKPKNAQYSDFYAEKYKKPILSRAMITILSKTCSGTQNLIKPWKIQTVLETCIDKPSIQIVRDSFIAKYGSEVATDKKVMRVYMKVFQAYRKCF